MADALRITYSESPALARLLRGGGEAVRRAGILAAKRGAEEYVDAMRDYIQERRPFTPRTGLLEGSIGWRAEGDGALVYAGGPTAPHAWYVESGTEAHVIEPRPGRKALRWYPAGGGVAFAGRVQHPGTEPRPYFFADLPARQARILNVARQALAERLLGGGTTGA